MGRITTNVGLITGVPIADTVEKLLALSARPRDLVIARTKTIEKQQLGVTELSALLLAFQITTTNLGKSEVFEARTVTSSQPELLSATSFGKPPLGSFLFTPVQTVQAHQLLSSGVANAAAPIGPGTLSLGFGGFVDQDTTLDLLNGGAGIQRGRFRITDRSGATAEIDLRFAKTVDDVLRAVNENATINVRLEVHGDRFRLVDLTGQTQSNLKVQEIGSGKTAATLGLAGINLASSSANGSDVIRLFNQLDTDLLNDGNGVRLNRIHADLRVTFRDGSGPLDIDFQRLAVQGTHARATTSAANGPDAAITITADTAGSAYAGVSILFEDDAAVVAGQETVIYDAAARQLKFKIDAGATTANQVIDALNRDELVSPLFSAVKSTGGNGTGLVSVTDTGVTSGPQATATTPGFQGENAQVKFTAVQGGGDFDNVTIEFVDNPAISSGDETVNFDTSDPNNKRLVFQIDAGNTKATHIVAALARDADVSQLFTASLTPGSDGLGVIDVADSTITAGGALIEPRAGGNEQSLGDLLATINAADPSRLRAELAPGGDRLRLIDLTEELGGVFGVHSINGSQAAADLGLAGPADGGLIESRRLFAGLNTSLVTSLDGGRGLGALGSLVLTDRLGTTQTVELSGSETVQEILDTINDSGLGILARVNTARNGIELLDTTGAASGRLIVRSGDATNTAEKLNLAVDAEVSSVNSGSLHRRSVSENTRLAALNGGGGVGKGTLTLTDTLGSTAVLNLTGTNIQTVGDVLAEIKRLGLGIDARINDAGDGILLVDTVGGSAPLQVTAGSGTTARDLHLLGGATTISIQGTPTKVIDGSTTVTLQVEAGDSLNTLVEKINERAVGIIAGVFHDGSNFNPARLTLVSQQPGLAGQLRVDASQASLQFEETARAQDALLLFGAGTGTLASSSTNSFSEILPGVNLQVNAPSLTPVTVSVASTDTNLVAAVQAAVDNYNRFREKLSALTAYDADQEQGGPLLGDGNVLRVETEVSALLSGRFLGAGSIRSLETLGISLNEDGTLEFNTEQLREKFAEDPQAVQQFFTTEKTGFAAKFKKAIDQLVGEDGSLLTNRLESLAHKVEQSNLRVEFLNERLEAQRNRLLNSFFQSELAVSKIQSSLAALQSLAGISLNSNSSNTSN